MSKEEGDPCFISLADKDLSHLLPAALNNPFSGSSPEICQVAAEHLWEYIEEHQKKWTQNFGFSTSKEGPVKGKMFGVLVVKNEQGALGYLATFSGKFQGAPHPEIFVPSLFDITSENQFFSQGMRDLTAMGIQINDLEKGVSEHDRLAAEALREQRKDKSRYLQDYLFSNYHFLNKAGHSKNLLEIFADYNNIKPPSGAGECAAPKLLHYAFKHNMKALAIAEFWWGNTRKPAGRKHQHYYPACDNKCRPILDYMLGENVT
jgi:tRNA pseudouridine32 synthase/23S rRNA pseudouridine746 synthase